MSKFIIIDGNSLANRAFYAMPYLSNHKRQPSGAVFGFANILVKLITEQKPDYVAVAFDHARKTFRNDIYANYKGTRKETPEDLKAQFPVVKQMLDVMGVKTFEFAGFEADDIIGTLARKSGVQNILVSGDRDLLQLIDDNTSVWLTRKGVTEIEKFDEKALNEKYGVKPSGIIDLKALMGDASDNIPGVAGVGEKTALSLLGNYSSLEGVYQNIENITGKLREKLENGKNDAFMSKTLATIKTDCDFDFSLSECAYEFPFSQRVYDFFADWDFKSLIARKDIFNGIVGSVKSEVKRKAFNSLKEIEEFVGRIDNVFCYDFSKLEFSDGKGNIFEIAKEINLFSETVDLVDAIKVLKPLFENGKILKITNNSKDDIKILKRHGICLNNFFDLEIAKYVLYAGLAKSVLTPIEEFVNEKNQIDQKLIEQGIEKIYYDVEIPLVSVLVDMEEEGFKIDEDSLAVLSEKYNAELAELISKIYDLAGEEFNINSPKQVGAILFDKLGLKSWNNKKNSTNFAVLDEIRDQHEIVEYIIQYRKLYKLLSTYINVYTNICKTSGPVVHTSFNQTLTSTGRLSSSEPNMQNIPTRDEEGKNLRKIFVSKYENGQIVSADYSQIELRLLANMANETAMIDAYNCGVDIHTKTASEIFDIPVEEVSSSQRRDAKAVNFGIIYGISDFGLSQNIKTTRANAKRYIENYFNRYPKIKEFMDGNIAYAKENGFVKSYFGRIRHIPEMSASNAMVRKFAERVAMNMPLQGTASDIIKMAMVEVFKQLKGMKSHVILQIHDELIVDAPPEEVEMVKNILKSSMEGVCQFAVPLTVSVSSGKSLFDCK